MAETIKKIIEVEINADAAARDSAALTAQLAMLRKEQGELNKTLKEAVALHGEQSDEAIAAGNALNQNKRKVAETAGEIRRLNKELDTNSNSLNAARQQLAKLNKEFDNLDQNAPGAGAEMKRLQKDIEALTKSISAQEQATGRFQRNVGNYAGGIKKAFGDMLGQYGQMAVTGGIVGAAVAGTVALVGGLNKAAQSAAEFDKQLSILAGASGLPKTSKEMQALEKQALTLGATTEYTATQVAQAQTELAKAGLSTQQVLDTTASTLNLATAGQLELADAATLTADTLTQFQLPADNAGRVVDALAYGANKSTTDVTQLGISLKNIAPIAAAMGVSIEETVTLVSQLAAAGFKGENATAALRTSLLRLASPSKEAAAVIKQTGLQVFDAQGKFVGFEGTIRELTKATKGMTDEARANYLSTILGSEATGQWTALITRGADEFNKFNKELNAATDGNGKFTESLAKTNLDNYAGAVQEFDGAVETLSITLGSKLLPALTAVAKWATSLVNTFTGEKSLKTAFADFAASAIKIGSALNPFGDNTKAADAIYNWGHANEKAAKQTEEAAAVAAVAAQKQKEATQTVANGLKTNAELIQQTAQLKKEAAAAAAETSKAREKEIEQLQLEQYYLDQLEASLGKYEEQQRLINATLEARASAQRVGDMTPELGGGNFGVPVSVAQEISNARIDIAETEAETLTRIRRENQQSTTENVLELMATWQKYGGEVATITNGLGNLWAQQEARKLAETEGNEAAQLEIKRKYAKRQAVISSIDAVISGLAGAQQTIENLGLPLAIPFLAVQAGITAANVAGILSNAGKFAKGGLTDGGIFSGPSHAGGGVKFAVGGRIMEAEGGEAILTKRATAMFRPILSEMNVAGGGRAFAAGGTVPQPTANILAAGDAAMSVTQTPIFVRVTDIQSGLTTVRGREANVI